MERVTAQWQALAARADADPASGCRAAWQDAYYQLVYYQVKATANLYALRQAEFTNILYAAQGRAATNDLADAGRGPASPRTWRWRTTTTHTLAGGKWNGFQTPAAHRVRRRGPVRPERAVAAAGDGTTWRCPTRSSRAVRRIEVPEAAELGVAIDGSEAWWPAASTPAVLPSSARTRRQPAQYLEVFNRGATPFDYRSRPAVPWLTVSPRRGHASSKQVRATVRVDWRRAPAGHDRPCRSR